MPTDPTPIQDLPENNLTAGRFADDQSLVSVQFQGLALTLPAKIKLGLFEAFSGCLIDWVNAQQDGRDLSGIDLENFDPETFLAKPPLPEVQPSIIQPEQA